MGRNNNAYYMMRIVVGGYLVYLSWSLASGMMNGEGDVTPFFIISAVLFAVAGIAIVVFSARKLLGGSSDAGIEDTTDTSETQISEEETEE